MRLWYFVTLILWYYETMIFWDYDTMSQNHIIFALLKRVCVCVCVCVCVVGVCVWLVCVCVVGVCVCVSHTLFQRAFVSCCTFKEGEEAGPSVFLSNKDTDELLVISIGTPMDVPANTSWHVMETALGFLSFWIVKLFDCQWHSWESLPCRPVPFFFFNCFNTWLNQFSWFCTVTTLDRV